MDMFGAVGYVESLIGLCPTSLGPKLAASGLPLPIMAGVLSEVEPTTLRVSEWIGL